MGRDVHKVGDGVSVVLGVGLVNLIRAISVWVEGLIVALFEDPVVKVKVAVGVVVPVRLEGPTCSIWETLRQFVKIQIVLV